MPTDPHPVQLRIIIPVKLREPFRYIHFKRYPIVIFPAIKYSVPVDNIAQIAGP
jgi:hypothetical protein